MQMNNPEAELHAELVQIASLMSEGNPNNKFKAMLYNFTPRGADVRALQNNRNQINEKGESIMMDPALHIEALSKNPDPDRLYPWQISSCEKLYERLRSDSNTIDFYLEKFDICESSLQEIQNDFYIKYPERIRQITEGQSKLMEKLCMTRYKLERYLESRNALAKDSGLEMRIVAKQDQIKKKLEIKNKIDKLDPSNVHEIKSFSVPQEKLDDIVAVMEMQRASIADLRKLVLSDLTKIQSVESSLEKIKK